MAETIRGKDDFNNATDGLFKNNTTGEISSQDLRDLVESLAFSFGSFYVSSSSATTVSASSTFYKAAGTTTGGTLRNFTMPADNRLKYDGTPAVHVAGTACLSMTTASSNQVCRVAIYYYDASATSGSVLTQTIIERKQGTGSDVAAIACGFDLEMETDDYIELHVSNETTASNVTINFCNMFALAIFK